MSRRRIGNASTVASSSSGSDSFRARSRARSRARPTEQFPRPRRALAPAAGALLGLGAWGAVAHSSGSGWVQALGALLAGFLLIGAVAPGIVTRRALCEVMSNPTDVTAGQDVEITIRVSTPLKVTPISPEGPDSTAGSNKTMIATLRPKMRGEVSTCLLDVSSAAPFGLIWWHKLVALPLATTMFVAPRLQEPDPTNVTPDALPSDAGDNVDARVGEPRGIREYRPGDKRSWVHWPATAHFGSLMVREMEIPVAPPVTIRVTLPIDPELAEQAAGRALGTVAALINQGRQVILVTRESDGVNSSIVSDVTDAGRRLARAIPEHVALDPRLFAANQSPLAGQSPLADRSPVVGRPR